MSDDAGPDVQPPVEKKAYNKGWANLIPIKPGEIRNPHGCKGKHPVSLTKILHNKLSEVDPKEGRQVAELIVEEIIRQARSRRGLFAAKELWNRTDGLPTQHVEINKKEISLKVNDLESFMTQMGLLGGEEEIPDTQVGTEEKYLIYCPLHLVCQEAHYVGDATGNDYGTGVVEAVESEAVRADLSQKRERASLRAPIHSEAGLPGGRPDDLVQEPPDSPRSVRDTARDSTRTTISRFKLAQTESKPLQIEGTSQSMGENPCFSCSGSFCPIIGQRVSWCHKAKAPISPSPT